MKKHAFVLLALTLVFGFGSGVSAADDAKVQSSLIVSTEWVAKHLNDDAIVLLHVGDKDEYLATHIPGAQLITLADISTPRGQGLTLELPSVDQLKATFEKLGITDKSRIVVYFGKDWVTPTARVFMTLDYLGLGDRTSILDGGLPAWRSEGRPVTAELREPKRGTFTPRPNAKLVIDAAWVSANLNQTGVTRGRRSSTPARKPARCRAPVTSPAQRAFRFQAWSKIPPTSSRVQKLCADSSTPPA
jgi:thiosulfate/3-mercaptopyruvate sulfurtransferase